MELPTDAPVPRGTGASASQLARYADLIRSAPHNLMSPRGLDELTTRHLPECEAFARTLPEDALEVVDVGSGAGLPGIVVALARPAYRVTLLEATGKKAAFLGDVIATLDVANVTVRNARAEDLHGELGGRFDLATARAVAPLERLIPWVLPLLRPGGRLHAIKGERWREELADAADALRATGARIVSRPVEVPPAPTPRVVTIERTAP